MNLAIATTIQNCFHFSFMVEVKVNSLQVNSIEFIKKKKCSISIIFEMTKKKPFILSENRLIKSPNVK